MSTSEPAFHPGQFDREELPDYRPLCVSAFIGLLLGLASPAAVLHPVLWLIPAVAIGVNAYALYQISQLENAAGRWMAVVGLFLSLLTLGFAPARVYSYEYLQRRDARAYAQQWFDALAEGRADRAHQLAAAPSTRATTDEHIRALYQQSETQRQNLRDYIGRPLVRALLALGPKAEVRYYENEMAQTDGDIDLVKDVYAVSFDRAGRKHTFFVQVELARNLDPEEGAVGWRISLTDGGYRPRSWPKDDTAVR